MHLLVYDGLPERFHQVLLVFGELPLDILPDPGGVEVRFAVDQGFEIGQSRVDFVLNLRLQLIQLLLEVDLLLAEDLELPLPVRRLAKLSLVFLDLLILPTLHRVVDQLNHCHFGRIRVPPTGERDASEAALPALFDVPRSNSLLQVVDGLLSEQVLPDEIVAALAVIHHGLVH